MEEAFKSRVIIGLSILSLIFMVSTVASCNKVAQQQKGRLKEIEKRFDAEEKLKKVSENQTSSEEQIGKLMQELDNAKSDLDAGKKALLQEELVNQSLKEELIKISKIKEALEENLKEALVSSKPAVVPLKPKK